MEKPRFLPEITYMRGLCMLGVIAIHVGSIAISNPLANVQLISVLEILSRFCVPAFFFLSAFGLFYHTPVTADFSYKQFIKRRLKVVLVPYVVWSFFYVLYSAIGAHNYSGLWPHHFGVTLFFGNGFYHLYFMVILIWFYLLMPLWRWAVKAILKAPVAWMIGLWLIQTGINFWSSYLAGHIVLSNSLAQYALAQRLNYWILHYFWVFLFGAVVAERYQVVTAWLWKYRLLVTVGFLISVGLMLGSYYYVMGQWHYTLLEAIYTVHQLSPMGMVYTAMGIIFFLFFFQVTPLSSAMRAFWKGMGDTSYGMYLVHPFMLIILTTVLAKMQMLLTVLVVVALYVCTICLSYFCTRLFQICPTWLRCLLIGR